MGLGNGIWNVGSSHSHNSHHFPGFKKPGQKVNLNVGKRDKGPLIH
jgi:hypothetical protein